MSGDESLPGEASLVNPAVVRGPNGIWDEGTLPVMDWEDVAHRVVLPGDVRRKSRIGVRTCRWSHEKLATVRVGRPELEAIIATLSIELCGWTYIGVEKKTGNTRIIFTGSDGRHYALTLGKDRHGSWNVITLVGSKNPAFVRNRLRGMRDIQIKD